LPIWAGVTERRELTNYSSVEQNMLPVTTSKIGKLNKIVQLFSKIGKLN